MSFAPKRMTWTQCGRFLVGLTAVFLHRVKPPLAPSKLIKPAETNLTVSTLIFPSWLPSSNASPHLLPDYVTFGRTRFPQMQRLDSLWPSISHNSLQTSSLCKLKHLGSASSKSTEEEKHLGCFSCACACVKKTCLVFEPGMVFRSIIHLFLSTHLFNLIFSHLIFSLLKQT